MPSFFCFFLSGKHKGPTFCLSILRFSFQASNGHAITNGHHPPPSATNGNASHIVTSFPAFSGSLPSSNPATSSQTGNGSQTMTSHPATCSQIGNHIPFGLSSASAAATLRPSYHRSISYTQPTSYMQRSGKHDFVTFSFK